MDVEGTRSGPEMVEVLRRWHDAGAVWRVVDRDHGHVTVSLLRCDAGEEVDRLTSRDPQWLAFLAGHESSED